jgi:hypothetical protein
MCCSIVRYASICSVPYVRSYYDTDKAMASLLEAQFTFIVQATAIIIINYGRYTFTVQAADLRIKFATSSGQSILDTNAFWQRRNECLFQTSPFSPG